MKKKRYLDTGFKGDAEGKLKVMAYENCKECYGRGYIGTMQKTGEPVACICIKTTGLNIKFIELYGKECLI